MKRRGFGKEWKEQRGETAESIENTRREVCQTVEIQTSNGRLLKGRRLGKEWKKQRGETVESIEHTRREGSDGI